MLSGSAGTGTASVSVSPTATATYTLTSVYSGGASYPVTGSATVTVNALPTAAISGTASIASGSGAPLTFSGTANAVVTYAWSGPSSATATLGSGGTATVTVSPTVTTTYTLTTAVSAAGCSQTITGQTATITVTAVTSPTVAITGTSPAAANTGKGSTNVLLEQYNLSVTGASATLSGLTVTTAGTYVSADITDIKCWYSSSSTFDATATLLSAYTTPGVAGSKVFPSFTSQTLPVGAGYIYVTADIAAAATAAHTINIASTALSNFSLGTATVTGTAVAAANAVTIVGYSEPAPFDLSAGSWTLTGWRTAAPALYYPGNGADGSGAGEVTPATSANMVFHLMNVGDPTLTAVANADYVSAYNGISSTRMRGEGTSGFGWLTTGNYLGEAVLGLKTTGRNHIQVSWTAGEFSVGARVYYVRAQYRIGTTGSYTDLPNTTYDQITDTSTVVGVKNFGPITLPSVCENQPVVEVRWAYYYNPVVTSGNRPEKVVTNINVTSNAIGATPTVAISSASPSRSNVTPGTTNLVLQSYNMNVTGSTDTISGLTITTGGNYVPSDINNIKLWYSASATFSAATATLLSTISSPTGAGSQSFPAFSKAMDVIGGTKYFYVTTDVSTSAASGDSINIGGTPFSNINLGTTATATGTNPVAAASFQTINAPSVALSSASPATGNIGAGTINNVIDAYSLTVSTSPATLSGLTVTTAGTYTAADVSNFKCWFSTSSTFSAATATLLSTKTTSLNAGTQVFPAFTSTVIPVGSGYIYITTDLTSGAVSGDNIRIFADSFTYFNFGVAAVTGTNPVAASNLQTIANASVAISSTSPAAQNVGVGHTSVLLQTYDLSVTSVAAAISGLTITTAGTYTASDVSNLECWYSSSPVFSTSTATLLSTLSAPAAAGSQVFPSFTTQTIGAGTTGYLFITVNITTAATAGHTINVAGTPFSGFNFGSATLTGTNPVAAANIFTITTYTDPAPFALSGGNYLFNNWPSASAAGTYPNNMIFHYMSTNPATLTSVPGGDYVAAYNYPTNSRISGQGTNGFSMFNNGSGNGGMPAGEYGEAVLALNTAGRSNIQVSWTAGTISANTSVWAIRAQYRVGTTGSYTDLPYTAVGQIEDTSSTGGASRSFGPITLPAACEGVADVEVRWIYYSQSGTSAPEMNVTNVQVTSTVAATSSVAVSASAPAAGNISQGATNNVLQVYNLGVTAGTATLSGLSVSTAGSYSASDISNLKCWYSSSSAFNAAAATLLATNTSVSGSGSQAFPSFTPQAVPVGTGYLFITADVAAGAALGDAIKIDTTSFADFNFGTATLTGTNPVAGANLQTIVTPPAVAVSSSSPASGSVYAGSTVLLQAYNLSVSTAPVTLNGMTVSTNGTYAAADITDLKCWYSSSATFSAGTATLLSAKTTALGAGTQVFPSFSSQVIPAGTGYIYITADVAALPSAGNTIYVDTTHFADFTFGAATLTGTNPVAAGGVQTISVHDPAAYNLSLGTYTFNNWPSSSAAGTYPANMIFHYMNAADPLITSVPSADYTGIYSSTTNAGMQGQGSSGFVFYNKGGVNIGEAVLAVNTTGEVNVKVGWTGGTFVASTGSRTYAIKAQYRIGTTGAYTDLTTDTTLDEYTSNGAATGSYSFAPVTLPSSCENQADVEVRWLFYYIGTSTGNRPQLNVTNITVSGNAPSAVITGSATACIGSSATISVTGGTPGAVVTLSPGGSSFTLSGTGSGSVTVTPSVTTTYTAIVSKSGATAAATGAYTVNVTDQHWNGTVSTDWSTADNWACGSIPSVTDNVTIGPGTPYAPAVSSGTVYSNNLTINSAILTLNTGAQLNISGNLTNNSTIAGSGVVYLNGTAAQQIRGNGAVSNLTLNNTSGAAIIDSAADTLGIGGTLLLNAGTLATNGRLMLLSGDSVTGRIGTITGGGITGNVIAQQYIPGGRRAYRFWSHPFNGSIALSQLQAYIDITGHGGISNGFTATTSNAPSAYWYNTLYGNSDSGSDPGWRAFTSVYGTPDSNMLHRYEGMRVFIRGAKGEGLTGAAYTADPVMIRMYGNVNTGTQNVTMTKGSGAYQDYNLLGNPYPSPVDLGAVIASASSGGLTTGAAFYVWDPYMGTSGQFITRSIGGSYYLGANESFEVRTAADGNTLTFHESNKAGTVTAALLRNSNGGNAIDLTIYDTAYHVWDMLSVKFDTAATEAEDAKYDGEKPSGPASLNFYSWSADHHKLSLDARPFAADKVIPLGLTSSYAQDFIVKADDLSVPSGMEVYLHDKYLGQYKLLQQGAEYRFTISSRAASQGDRFELSMRSSAGTAVQSSAHLQVQLVPNPATDDVSITYAAAGKALTTVRILNMEGVMVLAKDLGLQQSGTIQIPLEQLAAGVYMIEVTSGTEKTISRLVKE
jgi:hypothetical protein